MAAPQNKTKRADTHNLTVKGRNGEQRTAQLDVASELRQKELGWLWEPYLPLGKVCALGGHPGVGKTWIATAIAAAVTRGSEGQSPGNVIYVTGEDSPLDTLVPRFVSQNGCPERLLFWSSISVDSKSESQPQLDFLSYSNGDTFATVCEKHRPKLIVFDPWLAFSYGDSLAGSNPRRSVLTWLNWCARYYGFAALLVDYIGRANPAVPVKSLRASSELAAAARSVLFAGKTPEGRCAMVHVKSNLGELGPSIEYVFENGRFAWKGPCGITFEDLFDAEFTNTAPGSLVRAKAFLEEALKDGPVPIETLLQMSQCSRRTLFRAKDQLGIVARKSGEADGPWMWALPEQGTGIAPAAGDRSR